MAYIANTPDDTRLMLSAIGLDSLEQLFDLIPPESGSRHPLRVPPALTELELTDHIGAILALNQGADQRVCFLGGGSYDHFMPAVVDNLAARGEFYTAYTPYQAEASQGTLQATFEYQTLMTQLTGLDVSNASLYDGGSATAEAMLMALAITRRYGRDRGRRFGPSRVPPDPCRPSSPTSEPKLVDGTGDGRTGLPRVDRAGRHRPDRRRGGPVPQLSWASSKTCEAIVAAAHAKGALAIVSVDPISLGLLNRPGDYGADIVVAEGQSLGNPLSYGGPYLGIMACREEYVRKMPGRIVGETTDRNGKRCWVLTLQTREQHIRREKATSNICTNQGLLALRACIYLAVMGPNGLRQAAELSTRKAHYAAERWPPCPAFRWRFPGPFFKEFVVRSQKDPQRRSSRKSAGSATTAASPGPLVSRARRLHPDRRDRETDEGRNRRAGRRV